MTNAEHAKGDAQRKFQHPDITADGEKRAVVPFDALQTLWLNTGTLCNIECAHCYIESSPQNDRLVYLTLDDALPFLDEAKDMGAREIGLTGGEPFMNKDAPRIIEAALERGFELLVLTNAMRPMMRKNVQDALTALNHQYGDQLRLRVSFDHHEAAIHDEERGAGSFAIACEGLAWLDAGGFSWSIAGRMRWGEAEEKIRAGYADFLANNNLSLNANDPSSLVLFPEMDEAADTPEITTKCWDILDVSPKAMMCSNARMVVRRKGADAPSVLACTLLAYDDAFELGSTLKSARAPVKLNHPHCSKFCVLGGASCSG